MVPAKSVHISLVALLLLGAFSFSGRFAHLEEHSLNSAHEHSHNGANHSHEHGSGPDHHDLSPAPLFPVREHQILAVPPHRSAGAGSPFLPALLAGPVFESPELLFRAAPPFSSLSPAIPHSGLRSGRSPPSRRC